MANVVDKVLRWLSASPLIIVKFPVYCLVREIPGMASLMLEVELLLPPVATGYIGEVVKRKLSLKLTADGSSTDHFVAPEAPSYKFRVDGDGSAVVSGHLVDVDDAGNLSEATEFGPWIVNDTFPPPAPGPIGIGDVIEVPVGAPDLPPQDVTT